MILHKYLCIITGLLPLFQEGNAHIFSDHTDDSQEREEPMLPQWSTPVSKVTRKGMCLSLHLVSITSKQKEVVNYFLQLITGFSLSFRVEGRVTEVGGAHASRLWRDAKLGGSGGMPPREIF
jgi:hypothetical protein